ncbi:LysR family transcriptional regulator [uncultured Paraglaciecola sp.]|uniref:LysR family transcriptional regulator n=1 Tax=uncultured Paraglaciecola sp. TaxID=1765024 RepID=UPI0025982BF9|nr:LysR family transcriptional regulator [uncultured Paraglaciecola sp.]
MMNKSMTLKQLNAFSTVARFGSFAEACEYLHISQPALSISVKNLEDVVGGRLFYRTTRALVLTPEGKVFLNSARRLLLDAESSLGEIKNLFGLSRGLLNIAVMPSFASANLAKYIQNFKSECPAVNIKIFDVVAEEAIEMVRLERAELAITFEPSELDDLSFEPLFTDEFVAALPTGHILLENQNVSWEQLTRFPFIALQKPSNIRYLIEQSLATVGGNISVEIEANQLLTIVTLIAKGLGVSAMPQIYANNIVQSGIEYRPLVIPTVTRNIGIITKKRAPLSKSAEQFIKTLCGGFVD